ncbi:MAG: GTP pyrophosphokinase [Phocaeicola sp.]
MNRILSSIAKKMEQDLSAKLSKCGLMFRLFSRVKSSESLSTKVALKGDKYRREGTKIQDMIGLRIVAYFQDDVDILACYYSYSDLIQSSIDELNSSTFCPQRLNLVCSLPAEVVEEFRRAIPEEFAPYIDDTYEIQIRTIFSEGWHEVEHDLRYKCKEDWDNCEYYSRVLNGVIATLETAEWNMKALFNDMARTNLRLGNFRAMLRNKMHLRMKDDGFSERIEEELKKYPDIAEGLFNTERIIIILTMLNHKGSIKLTYDNLLFLVNRIELKNARLASLEPDETKQMLDAFFES